MSSSRSEKSCRHQKVMVTSNIQHHNVLSCLHGRQRLMMDTERYVNTRQSMRNNLGVPLTVSLPVGASNTAKALRCKRHSTPLLSTCRSSETSPDCMTSKYKACEATRTSKDCAASYSGRRSCNANRRNKLGSQVTPGAITDPSIGEQVQLAGAKIG